MKSIDQRTTVLTNAEVIIQRLQRAGVKRLFGMPGGGSNADLIEAAVRSGMPFSLAHTETSSAFMAAAQAEITGTPGACLATLGPGAASLMNGVANAYLDRVPILVLTDSHDDSAHDIMQHQNLPQTQMFAPVTKFSSRLARENFGVVLEQAFDALSSLPPGPVHLDIPGEVTASTSGQGMRHNPPAPEPNYNSPTVSTSVQALLRSARRPVFLIGLGARTTAIADAVRSASERFGIPALVTYKAKGVVPDRHPWFAGVLTNGALERAVLERADIFLAVGLDPVELLPRPWKLQQPVLSITDSCMKQSQIRCAAEIIGDVTSSVTEIGSFLSGKTIWEQTEIQRLVQEQREKMRPDGEPGKLWPHRVVELTAKEYTGARATVDAGAHMFPVMSLWPAEVPCGVLISNGLSTMGFALPSAIGASLLDNSKPTVVFTGDAGLMMCLGDLRTAAREGLRLRIIVFDDSALSLIKIKQLGRKYATEGVTIGKMDWPALAASMGVRGMYADSEDSLSGHLRESLNYGGPVLIAAKIAPETYAQTIHALRG